MRCMHERTRYKVCQRFVPGDFPRTSAGPLGFGEQRCETCGEIVPYGPSNDADERVRVEIRAIEVVNARAAQRVDLVTSDELLGWNYHECNTVDAGDFNADLSAGWLARCMWTHCDDHAAHSDGGDDAGV